MEVSLATLEPMLPEDLRHLVKTALGAVLALAARAAHSSRDSNSLGGIFYLPRTCPGGNARVRHHTATTHPLLPHALIFATIAQTWYNDNSGMTALLTLIS